MTENAQKKVVQLVSRRVSPDVPSNPPSPSDFPILPLNAIPNQVAFAGQVSPDVCSPAHIDDHDELSGFRSAKAWPESAGNHTLRVHFHFCELIHAWNLNPFKRDASVATVDELAEEKGLSRFFFTSLESLNDFTDFYSLDDFIVNKPSGVPDVLTGHTIWTLNLNNKFGSHEVNEFHLVYRQVMAELSVIETERRRAIMNDGNRVGVITVEHFNARETFEMTRLKQARIKLGAPNERF